MIASGMSQAIAPARAPSAYPPAAAAPLSSDDILSTIEKLHRLLAKGILKPEEFEAKKAQLLRRLH